MAVNENNVLLTGKTAAGDTNLLYPITKLDCVDGAEDLLHYGQTQELTDEQKAQARANIGAASESDISSVTAITTDQINALFSN